MDIFLTNAACDTVLAGSPTRNLGGDPVGVFPFTNSGPATSFGIIIVRFAGPNPGLMKFVGNGAVTINEFDTKTGTSWGHSTALGGLGVGAARYQDTPAFGVNPPLIEAFSSAGGTPILFDTAGNRLATPEVRQQPDITAPDGGDTTFFIPGVDSDVTGFPNFFGTSAAAPHAAGVAALMKALVPSLMPDSTYAVLKTTAIDMDDPSTGGFDTGFDFGTGFGLIQADRAINEVLCRGLPATIVGTEGRDIIIGTPGPDVIHGLGGNDVIRGGRGDDLICGGPGRDRLSGGPGRDRLFGDSGRDRLDGGAGRDRCWGGGGTDIGFRCEALR
jgi:Ca2+-binding RTX toxin-like protein